MKGDDDISVKFTLRRVINDDQRVTELVSAGFRGKDTKSSINKTEDELDPVLTRAEREEEKRVRDTLFADPGEKGEGKLADNKSTTFIN